MTIYFNQKWRGVYKKAELNAWGSKHPCTVRPLHNFMLNACFTIPWDDIFKIYCRSNRVKKIDNWRIICHYGHYKNCLINSLKDKNWLNIFCLLYRFCQCCSIVLDPKMTQTRWFMCNITVIYYMFRNNVPACELDFRKKSWNFSWQFSFATNEFKINYDEVQLSF